MVDTNELADVLFEDDRWSSAVAEGQQLEMMSKGPATFSIEVNVDR